MPQWQGGDEPAYKFGAELLSWLLPTHKGPEAVVSVPDAKGSEAPVEQGIKWRKSLLSQARAARAEIELHNPDRIVTLGGDCLVDLAPIAYLSRKYGDTLGVLWLDAHPDIMSADEFSHAHAHVLGMLLGRGDAEFTAEVPVKLSPLQVMIAGMKGWSVPEGKILDELGLQHIPAAALAETTQPILDWISAAGITHLAVHFDLDVLDPVHFSPLLFNKPDAPAGAFDGIEQGQMRLEQIIRVLNDVAAAIDVVGLAITEHLPWDMLRLRNGLAELAILKS